MSSVKERFLRYVQVETTSCEANECCPSTPGQKVLGEMLAGELAAMGVQGAFMDEHGYVYGFIPAKGKTDLQQSRFLSPQGASAAPWSPSC